MKGFRSKRGRRGFTLLEMLIALVLASVLMSGLWALLSTYERLFARGQTKVEEAQLARTLLEQISSDLKSAIPDHAAGLLGQSASLRRFGLFGTQRALQVDVLQVTPSQLLANPRPQETTLAPGRTGRVPELHTVQYLFEEPRERADPENPVLTGLVRRELDWETPASEAAVETTRDGLKNRPTSGVDPMDISAGGLDPADDSLLRVPEVVGLEFRYYDGSGWASQWNSLTQKSLPVAIEVLLSLKRAPETGSARRAKAPLAVEELPDVLAPEPRQMKGQTHRLLVFLPNTALLRASTVSAAAQPRGPIRPLPPPPPVFQTPPVSVPPTFPPPSGGSAQDALRSVLPEQWMRSGS
ncbi:MAG: prepilin-type N-terminal cleavage/methylation domain-containing protein, partial [Armatimonadota bacterium]